MNTPAKKIHRFLLETIPSGDRISVDDGRLVRHVSRVLGLQPGEEIALFTNGSDDTIFSIQRVDRSFVELERIRSVPAVSAPRTELIAAISIPKSDVFETIVQKLTELGVSTIAPIRSDRTVKQSVRLDRVQLISDEALEQCGGSTRVRILEPDDLEAVLANFTVPAFVFDASGQTLSNIVRPANSTEHDVPPSCMMYIGPEGGWSEHDRALFEKAQASIVTLGPRILRTDTAAIAAAYRILWASF